jgi:hypothetical protein
MTAIKKMALVAVVLSLVQLPAYGADIETGNGLVQACKEGDSKNLKGTLSLGVCVGYIVAIAHASNCGNNIYGYSSKVPDKAEYGQLVKIVRKWLDNHPEKLHLAASSLVAAALKDAFPCS